MSMYFSISNVVTRVILFVLELFLFVLLRFEASERVEKKSSEVEEDCFGEQAEGGGTGGIVSVFM